MIPFSDKWEFFPEQVLQEVLNFVDFVPSHHQDQDWADPRLSVAGIFSGEAISAEEIEAELD